MWRVSIVLLAVGCLRDPKFKGVGGDGGTDADAAPDAGPPSCAGGDVVATRAGNNDNGASVCGPTYVMNFSDTGARMPYQLNVNGSQLMGGARECNDERATGVALFPPVLVNGETQNPDNTDGGIALRLTGPVIAKVEVDWSATYTCGQQGTLQNKSSFTFFPDGRITRWDQVRNATMVTNNGACTRCTVGGNPGPNSGNFFLTSYMTLQAPSNSVLASGDISMLTMHGQQLTGRRSDCLETLQRRVAFGWRDTNTRIRVVNETPTRALAFVYDIPHGGDDTIMPADLADDVTTQILVSPSAQCGDLRTRAELFAENHGLTINGVDMGMSPDGIYGGERHDGAIGIDAGTTGTVTIQPTTLTVPGNFAVWLDYDQQPNQTIVVTHNGIPSAPSGDWYRIQRVNNSQVIIWFRDDLAATSIITVTSS
jgi:hypothetical protein